MCETKRVAWRPEVPEHAQMGSIGGGGIKGQFWVFEGPRPSGTQNKMILSKNIFEKKACFFTLNWPKMPTKWAQIGSIGGYKGSIFGF